MFPVNGNRVSLEGALHFESRIAAIAGERRFGGMGDHVIAEVRGARERLPALLAG